MPAGGGDQQHGGERRGWGLGMAERAGVGELWGRNSGGEAAGGLSRLHTRAHERTQRILPPVHAGAAVLPGQPKVRLTHIVMIR